MGRRQRQRGSGRHSHAHENHRSDGGDLAQLCSWLVRPTLSLGPQEELVGEIQSFP